MNRALIIYKAQIREDLFKRNFLIAKYGREFGFSRGLFNTFYKEKMRNREARKEKNQKMAKKHADNAKFWSRLSGSEDQANYHKRQAEVAQEMVKIITAEENAELQLVEKEMMMLERSVEGVPHMENPIPVLDNGMEERPPQLEEVIQNKDEAENHDDCDVDGDDDNDNDNQDNDNNENDAESSLLAVNVQNLSPLEEMVSDDEDDEDNENDAESSPLAVNVQNLSPLVEMVSDNEDDENDAELVDYLANVSDDGDTTSEEIRGGFESEDDDDWE